MNAPFYSADLAHMRRRRPSTEGLLSPHRRLLGPYRSHPLIGLFRVMRNLGEKTAFKNFSIGLLLETSDDIKGGNCTAVRASFYLQEAVEFIATVSQARKLRHSYLITRRTRWKSSSDNYLTGRTISIKSSIKTTAWRDNVARGTQVYSL